MDLGLAKKLSCLGSLRRTGLYCRTIYKREGRRYYWSIDNSFKALQFLGNQENCTDILAADFSTLYTMLPHNVVLNALERMVKLTLKDDKKVSTNGYKTYVTDRDPHGYLSLSAEEIMGLVKDVLDETYVNFAGIVFKQIKGTYGWQRQPASGGFNTMRHGIRIYENYTHSSTTSGSLYR